MSTHPTNYVVTNDITQDSTEATHKACSYRWKIERGGWVGFPHISNHAVEQLHREGKQLTGWEKCQCCKARIQRNHIGCALLVWVRLKYLAIANKSSVYQLKNGLLKDYLIQQLKNPSLEMVLA